MQQLRLSFGNLYKIVPEECSMGKDEGLWLKNYAALISGPDGDSYFVVAWNHYPATPEDADSDQEFIGLYEATEL
jgi:hypothetical protein